MTSQLESPIKDPDREWPVASIWRPVFCAIVRAFVAGDYGLAGGMTGVSDLTAETASFIEESVAAYGDVELVELTDETWDTSVAIWHVTHWEVLIDLRTAEEGRSDLVLSVRVTETVDGFIFEIGMVYVP